MAHPSVAHIITFITTSEMFPDAVPGIGGASLSSCDGTGTVTAMICEPLMRCGIQRDAVR